jgi:hypothetical protein
MKKIKKNIDYLVMVILGTELDVLDNCSFRTMFISYRNLNRMSTSTIAYPEL